MYKYRSLEAWKHAHAAVIAVLRATDEKRQPKTWALFDQLRRAAVSVEANAVMTMLMMSGSNCFASRSTSTPFISGIRISVMRTSTRPPRSTSRA